MDALRTSSKLASLFILLITLFCTVSFTSCSEEDEPKDWTEEVIVEVGPDTVPVNSFGGLPPVECMLVKYQGSDNLHHWETWLIKGFTFEKGYRCKLKVEITHLVNPMQDGPNIEVRLISVISKEKV